MALENKLGLTSSAELAREEERISNGQRWTEGRVSCLGNACLEAKGQP